MTANPFFPYALTKLRFTSTLEDASGTAILLCYGARVAQVRGVGDVPSAHFWTASAQHVFEHHLDACDRKTFRSMTGKDLPAGADAAAVFLEALIEATVYAQEEHARAIGA